MPASPRNQHGRIVLTCTATLSCGCGKRLGAAAATGGATAVMCSGVDPGVSTMVRALFEIWAPTGLTHVTYGPGMSMGHTVAAKSYPGVRDALSITRPGDPGFHKREVYLEIEPGYEFEEVRAGSWPTRIFLTMTCACSRWTM